MRHHLKLPFYFFAIDEIKTEEYENEILEADAKNLSEELRQYVKRTGVTASEIAQDLGINRSSVTRWLNGNSLPRREGTINKVREYLLDKGLGN